MSSPRHFTAADGTEHWWLHGRPLTADDTTVFETVDDDTDRAVIAQLWRAGTPMRVAAVTANRIR